MSKLTKITELKKDSKGALVVKTYKTYYTIYRILFVDETMYIGKTLNIKERQNTHNNKWGKNQIKSFKILFGKEEDSSKEKKMIIRYIDKFGKENIRNININPQTTIAPEELKTFPIWEHETASQLAIRAWYYYIEPTNTCTMAEAAKKFGASIANIKRANKIGGTKSKHFKRPDILDMIFHGEKFTIEHTKTDSLATIQNFLEQQYLDRKSEETGIKLSEDNLSETEEEFVTAIFLKVSKESIRVQKAIAKRIYSSSIKSED
jgi:predicted GIY-YIG superfamily endonuclease